VSAPGRNRSAQQVRDLLPTLQGFSPDENPSPRSTASVKHKYTRTELNVVMPVTRLRDWLPLVLED
jgi:hypothetical protein